jgi:hypothetical protein
VGPQPIQNGPDSELKPYQAQTTKHRNLNAEWLVQPSTTEKACVALPFIGSNDYILIDFLLGA